MSQELNLTLSCSIHTQTFLSKQIELLVIEIWVLTFFQIWISHQEQIHCIYEKYVHCLSFEVKELLVLPVNFFWIQCPNTWDPLKQCTWPCDKGQWWMTGIATIHCLEDIKDIHHNRLSIHCFLACLLLWNSEDGSNKEVSQDES
jgi:hypothetical protein